MDNEDLELSQYNAAEEGLGVYELIPLFFDLVEQLDKRVVKSVDDHDQVSFEVRDHLLR